MLNIITFYSIPISFALIIILIFLFKKNNNTLSNEKTSSSRIIVISIITVVIFFSLFFYKFECGWNDGSPVDGLTVCSSVSYFWPFNLF